MYVCIYTSNFVAVLCSLLLPAFDAIINILLYTTFNAAEVIAVNYPTFIK